MPNSAKSQFDKAVLATTGKTDHLIENTVYYGLDYFIALLKDLGEEGIRTFAKELKADEAGKFKMCSVASSARLAYLYFRNDDNICFEANLPINLLDGKKNPIAHPDAYTKDGSRIFYECKCHEIFDSHSDEKLSSRYKTVIEKHFDVCGKVIGEELVLTQAQLGIGGKDDIYRMHFNVKQLLCHLMGIAENKEAAEPAELRYIFFVPSAADDFDAIQALKNEIESIKHSMVIQAMCEECNITLEQFDFINVRDLSDPIYNSLQKKEN